MSTHLHLEADVRTLYARSSDRSQPVLFQEDSSPFLIPAYQRPYSWETVNLERMCEDIFRSADWENGLKSPEPLFMGTIQVRTDPSASGNPDFPGPYEIVDGQQRLTTLILLLKAIDLKQGKTSTGIPYTEWLDSQVENGTQKTKLLEALQAGISSLNPDEKTHELFPEQNRFLYNLAELNRILGEALLNETGTPIADAADKLESLKAHICQRLQFVVIRTQASLSHTLSIFQTLNTAGLDLNVADLFKVRLHDYLMRSKQFTGSTECFTRINAWYQTVQEIIRNHGPHATSVQDALRYYQFWLVFRHALPNSLLTDFGIDRFYEILFDTLLHLREHEELPKNKAAEIRLSLEDLHAITDVIQCLLETTYSRTQEQEAQYTLIRMGFTRYTTYWRLLGLALLKLGKERIQDVYALQQYWFRLFFIYSVSYDKIINKVRSWVYEFGTELFREDGNLESARMILESRLKELDFDESIGVRMSINLVENTKRKNLIVYLSAVLDANPEVAHSIGTETQIHCIFHEPNDVEHIHAVKNETQEWDPTLLNGVGNLVLLERDINRRIQNKERQDKVPEYVKSKLSAIQLHLKTSNSETWTETDARDRLVSEVNKFREYFAGYLKPSPPQP